MCLDHANTQGRYLAALLHVGDDIVALLGLLEAGESHLGTGNVLLGVLEVVEEGLLSPGDVLLDVGLGVGESGSLARFAAKDAVQVRADLVGTALEEEGREIRREKTG
jgi:hypothetical protein